jgi:hypothetical protein
MYPLQPGDQDLQLLNQQIAVEKRAFRRLARGPFGVKLLALRSDKTAQGFDVVSGREAALFGTYDSYHKGSENDSKTPMIQRVIYPASSGRQLLIGARVVHAIIKSGSDYRPFVEGRVPGGRIPFCGAVRAPKG